MKKITKEEYDYLNLVESKPNFNDWMTGWNSNLNYKLYKKGYISLEFQCSSYMPGDVDLHLAYVTPRFLELKQNNLFIISEK